jgi:FlaG/FlaF family flagellin (archaellin)
VAVPSATPKSKLPIIIAVIVVVAIVVIASVLWFVVFKKGEGKETEEEKWEYAMRPTAALSISKVDNNYTVQVLDAYPPAKFSQIKWQIVSDEGLQAGNLTLVANANTSMSNTICVYTHDIDGDGKLSGGDMLKIWDTGEKTIQPYWKFRLYHTLTSSIMAETYFPW